MAGRLSGLDAGPSSRGEFDLIRPNSAKISNLFLNFERPPGEKRCDLAALRLCVEAGSSDPISAASCLLLKNQKILVFVAWLLCCSIPANSGKCS